MTRIRKCKSADKIRYPSRDAGLEAAILLDPSDLSLTPYFCPSCRGWHIGHRHSGPVSLERRRKKSQG